MTELTGGNRTIGRWTAKTAAAPSNLQRGEIATSLVSRTLFVGAGPGVAPLQLVGGAASSQALASLSQQLIALESAAATDADLAQSLAPIAAQIAALEAAGATDAELAIATTAIAQQVAGLSATDSTQAAQLQALQAALNGLNGTYATDADLAAEAALRVSGDQSVLAALPKRSVTPPVNPSIGQRWWELASDGTDIYDQPWVWRGEWQLERLYVTGTGSGRISGSSTPRLDLGLLPPWSNLAGYRLTKATLRHRLDGAGSWTARLRKFAAAATVSDWIGPTTITASGVSFFTLPVGSGALLDPAIVPALELNLSKGSTAPDSLFALTCQWAAVRA